MGNILNVTDMSDMTVFLFYNLFNYSISFLATRVTF